MLKELYSLAERLQSLREGAGFTQAEEARMLGITRSGVNAWEMGISVPSTQYIVELARLFHISTDYLLGVEETSTISVQGLTKRQVTSLLEIASCYREAMENSGVEDQKDYLQR